MRSLYKKTMQVEDACLLVMAKSRDSRVFCSSSESGPLSSSSCRRASGVIPENSSSRIKLDVRWTPGEVTKVWRARAFEDMKEEDERSGRVRLWNKI